MDFSLTAPLSIRLFALRLRRRGPPAFWHGSHAGFLRGWRRCFRIRLPPVFRHKGHAGFLRGWRCFSWRRRNHREGVAGGAGNLPPGVLRITFQALAAMGTVEFKGAHKAFIAAGAHPRRKRRNRPASFSMAAFGKPGWFVTSILTEGHMGSWVLSLLLFSGFRCVDLRPRWRPPKLHGAHLGLGVHRANPDHVAVW